MNQPTISDVALAAGVSVATVSRALRGLDRVHPETRERVLKAATELNYIASPTASSLASGRTRLIGIVTFAMARRFFTETISAIERTVREHEHHTLFLDLDEPSPAVRRTQTQGTMLKRVDGLVVINTELPESQHELVRRLALPVVAIGTRHDNSPLISVDDLTCAKTATDHLLELGHRRIAYLGAAPEGSSAYATPQTRFDGYRRSLDQAGISVSAQSVIECEWRADDAYRSMHELLDSNEDQPTAILAANYEVALGALAAARTVGLRVPDDLSIIGIDDHALATAFGLATVRQDAAAQGTAAAQALLAQLGLAPSDLASDRVFPVELITRQSTASPAD